MKRLISLLLLLSLVLCALCPAVLAAEAAPESTPIDQTIAEALSGIDVFRGTGEGFALDRAPTRLEAAVMLVRLNGAEEAAQQQFAAGEISHPFTDVDGWGEAYVAWLYSNGLVRGMSETEFGSRRACRTADYAVFLLRALGFAEGEDFTWKTATAVAAQHGFYTEGLFGGTFTRGDLALMTWFALFTPTNGSTTTLLQTLSDSGAVASSAARQLQSQYQSLGLALCADGIVLNSAKWRAALSSLTLSIDFSGAAPQLAVASLTLTGDDLAPLAVQIASTQVCIPNTAISSLASGWAEASARSDVPFLFDSYVKGWTEIDFLSCDYRLDEAESCKALLRQLLTLQSGELHLPLVCWRNGSRFSMGDTYVEVDFDNQKLTFFKNGELIVHSDVVTGRLRGRETPTGFYYAHNKQTNCVLVGSDFEVFVKYWVSIIYDAIGFHDASWRTVFGGDEYVNNGSHGCINTPEAAMATLFQNIEDGTPVLLYGQNEWYDVNDPNASPATR